MKGKNILIIGDSYSTFSGCIPKGYAVYYTGERTVGPNLTSPSQTWWGLLLNKRGGNLVLNDSASGSTIGYTGYNNTDVSKTTSFICRFEKMIENGFFSQNKIDIVFIFGGTNDCWCGAPAGKEMFSNWQKTDLYNVFPAIDYLFCKVRKTLPNSEIYGIANCDIDKNIVTAIKNACNYVNAKFVELDGVDKDCGHPTALGMEQIKNQIIKVMDS